LLHPPQFALSDVSSTQVDPHASSPEPHTRVQTLDTQVWVPLQALPHAPQLSPLTVRSTQTPLQLLCPLGQVQTPVLHVAVAGHALPHPPQLPVSELSLTHDVPHCVQTLPQLPQSLALDDVSTHALPQSIGVTPCVHAQALDTQVCPVAVQAVPHCPQSAVLLVKSTHALLQFVSPAAHDVVHSLKEQTSPLGQTIEHPPQLFGSDVVSTQVPLQSRPLAQTGPVSAPVSLAVPSLLEPSDVGPSSREPSSVDPSFVGDESFVVAASPASVWRSGSRRSVLPQPLERPMAPTSREPTNAIVRIE
jgi:hypothetical protein